MQLTPHAEELLKKSYYRKDKDGNVIENWEGLCRRVANHIAKGDYCANYLFSIVNMGVVPHIDHLYDRKNKEDKDCCGTCRNYNTCDKVKEIEDEFYNLLYNQYFIVNTPSLMNSGTELGGLSACFIIAIEDSMESILNAVKQMGIILKTGGGVGFSFGKVRQKGAKIGSTGGVSSGVISWLKIFNQVVEEVKQGGRRRGAGSCVLPVNHPDILEYLTCKTDNTVITNFNLSVGITDDFMAKVRNNEDYDLIEPHTGKIVGSLNAKEVFDTICKQAFVNGEPGLFFLDTVNKDNPVPKSGNIYSGNPCFEFVLPPYNSCTLGAINLSKIIDIERRGDGTPLVRAVESVKVVDYELFDSIISTAVRMLDNTITMNKFPIPEIEEVTLANRPIGLGFLNLSELFIKLGLVYGSDESLEMAEAVTKYMRKKAIETSIELAKERGAYPNFDPLDYCRVNYDYIPDGVSGDTGVRNSTVLSIAPNGSTGVIVNASSGGVEPIFAVSYKRKTVDCGDMHMVNPLFENTIFYKDEDTKNKYLTMIEDNGGIASNINDLPEDRKLFVTAREIPYEQHIKMQAAIQKHVDLSISKTVNLLSDTTVEDVKNAYTMAHELGCKGITIYREGSRENEVLSTKKKENQRISSELKDQPNYNYNYAINTAKALGIDTDKLGEPIEEDTYPEDDDFIPEVRERRDPVIGYTYKIGIHNLKIYITVNFNSDELTPIECFIAAGKPGDDINAITQSISRLVSLGLKFKIPIDEIINQLDSLAGEDIVWMGGGKILSVPDAVAKVLKWAMEKRSVDFVSKDPKIVTVKGPGKQYTNSTFTMFSKTNCPNCGDALVFQEGCRKCLSCDYNKCG